jgi:hypothetical protein
MRQAHAHAHHDTFPGTVERTSLVAPSARPGTVRLACAPATLRLVAVPPAATGGLGRGARTTAAGRTCLVWCAVVTLCVGALVGLTVGLYFALSSLESEVLGGVGDVDGVGGENASLVGSEAVAELLARASNRSSPSTPTPSSPLCPSTCDLCCVVDTTTLNVPIRIAEFVDLLPCDDPQIDHLRETPLKPHETCVARSCRAERCRGFFRSRGEFDACVDWSVPNYTAMVSLLDS